MDIAENKRETRKQHENTSDFGISVPNEAADT